MRKLRLCIHSNERRPHLSRSLNVYFFPTRTDVLQVSKSRVAPRNLSTTLRHLHREFTEQRPGNVLVSSWCYGPVAVPWEPKMRRRHVMKPIGIFLSLAVLFTAGRASAVVIEVPLPGLVGTYAETARTAEFQRPVLPSVINSVSLHVQGTAQIAYFSCDGLGGFGDPVPVPIQINTSMLVRREVGRRAERCESG
jgi:hypothetical protein